MKVLKSNSGTLTNFEVLDFLKSRGAAKDPTRVIARIAQSEYKVYDYLVETSACSQTRESINVFLEKCKNYGLARAEQLNIVNVRPSSLVEIESIIEKVEDRGINCEELLELVNEVLPPPPKSLDQGAAAEDAETEGHKHEQRPDESAEPMEIS